MKKTATVIANAINDYIFVHVNPVHMNIRRSIMAKQRFNLNISGVSLPHNTTENLSSVETGKVGVLLNQIDAHKPDTLLDCYKIIPRHQIRMNKKNDYPLDEIDKLKDLLLHWGVLQDILVIYSTEEDIYIIEAGHRRVTALDALIQEYQNWTGNSEDPDYLLYQKNIMPYENGYVCKVIERLPEDIDYDAEVDLEHLSEKVIDSEIRLIITNEGGRTISPATRARNIRRLDELYKRKNMGKPRSEKLNINATIAEQFSMTERQVINYKNTEKLIPELAELFEHGKISLKNAATYSALGETQQLEIAENISAGNPNTLDHTTSRKEVSKSSALNKNQDSAKTSLESLIKKIASEIQRMNNTASSLLLEIPDLEEWLDQQRNFLKELL